MKIIIRCWFRHGDLAKLSFLRFKSRFFHNAVIRCQPRSIYAFDLLRFLYFCSHCQLRAFLPTGFAPNQGHHVIPPVGCVTLAVYSTTMVVGGSRKPLFKFANYLMIGQTRTRPLQFPIRRVGRFPIALRLESDVRETTRGVIALRWCEAIVYFRSVNIRQKKNLASEQMQNSSYC